MTAPMRDVFGVWCAVVLLGCGGTAPGPMTVNGVKLPVGDGQELVAWKGVPVANVTWPGATTQLQNTIGQQGIGYELTDEARARGASLSLRFDGADQEHFEGEWETAAGGQVFGQVRCRPKRAGSFEVALVATAEGRDYRALLRCEGVSDYAMFLEMMTPCFRGADVIVRPGRVYSPASATLEEDAWATCRGRTATANGETWVRTDGTQAWRVTRGAGETPILTADDQRLLRNFGVQGISPEGSTVVFGDMGGLYVKRDGPLAVLDAWPGTRMGSRNALAFSADGAKVVVRAALFGESNFLQANWRVVDVVSGANERLVPTTLASALPAHGNRFAATPDLSKFLWGVAENGGLQLHFVDVAAGTQVRVFEDAMAHVKTLPGNEAAMPIVLTSDDVALTPDGRYAALALNAYTGTDYFGGKKGAYVVDLVENKTWSVGVLPDGSWWSANEWGYQAYVALTPDGQNVLFGVATSSGPRSDYFIVQALVPRRMWKAL